MIRISQLMLIAIATALFIDDSYATCPTTLSGTYLGIVEIEYFTSQTSSAFPFRKTNVRVRWVVNSSTQSGTTTSGSFTFYNYFGGSGSNTVAMSRRREPIHTIIQPVRVPIQRVMARRGFSQSLIVVPKYQRACSLGHQLL